MRGPPCEIAVKYVWPAFRNLVAKRLVNEYKLSQVEVARLLGVTQATVSYYLSGKRGSKFLMDYGNVDEIQKLAYSIADQLKEGRLTMDEIGRSFCSICKKLVIPQFDSPNEVTKICPPFS